MDVPSVVAQASMANATSDRCCAIGQSVVGLDVAAICNSRGVWCGPLPCRIDSDVLGR